jgi:hypothetical protein
MRRPAAGGIGAGGVDGAAPLFDINYFPFLIHHERSPVRHSVCEQNAIGRYYFTIEEIAQQGERCVELRGEFLLGWGVVGTNAKNFGVVAIEFCNTSLVCGDFARSTTGESRGEKRQHDGILAAKARKGYFTALGGRQSEVGRDIALL